MENSLTRLKKIKRAKDQFDEIFQKRQNALLIHYSCESFVENTKGSHKITSIAVRNLHSGQTHSFSIFQFAEEMKVKSINENFELIEKKLLESFFAFVKEHKNHIWIHWNMRDINYGFVALEHRLKALGAPGEQPEIIPDAAKYDLARLLFERYGKFFSPHPRLINLIKLNDISDRNFLSGDEEAEAFKSGDYLKLHQSTLRKVDIFENILTRVEEKDLKVAASFFQIHGFTSEAMIKTAKDHWICSLLVIAGIVVGLFLKLKELVSLYSLPWF